MKNHKFWMNAILVFMLSIALYGCSNHQEETPTELGDINEQDVSDDGYKPVIMYHGSLYWLSVEKPPKEMLDGFSSSQKKVESCVDDPMQLPKEELATSSSNCAGVGAYIYINETDDSKIVTATEDGAYLVFEKNQ